MPPASDALPDTGWEVPRPARRRWHGVVVGGLVAGLAALLVLAGGGDDHLTVEPRPPLGPTPGPSPAPSPAPSPEPPALSWARPTGAAGTWTTLPPAPLGPRTDPVVVWTGNGEGYSSRARGEVIVWGGHAGEGGLADGAAYDPMSGSWRPLPEAPHRWDWRSSRAATWTGSELVTLVRPGGEDQPLGLVYDPATDRWRETPPLPPPARVWHAVGWTGEEVVVLASPEGVRANLAAAYDPASDTWRPLPRAPVVDDRAALVAAALPAGLAVIGELRGHPAATLLAPGSATWTEPEPLPLDRRERANPLLAAAAVDADENRLLMAGVTRASGLGRRVWSWSPEEGWAELPALEADVDSSHTQLAWGLGRLLAWVGEGAQAGAVLEGDADDWRPMAPPPVSPRRGAGSAWTGRALVIWGGVHEGEALADGAVFLPGTGSDGRLRTGS